jgi:hypothetical protein
MCFMNYFSTEVTDSASYTNPLILHNHDIHNTIAIDGAECTFKRRI